MLLNPTKAVLAELVGTAVLVMAVVGSGISAQGLTDDRGLQLMINTGATVGVLAVLIAILLPITGAHLNPAVTLAMLTRRQVSLGRAMAYVPAQVLGGAAGTVVAHAMYAHPAAATFSGERSGAGVWLGELVATAGLVVVVLLVDRASLAWAVPAWIGAAYFVTSSTAFANPAVTVARALTDTLSGIRWGDVPLFVSAQLAGAALALALVASLDRQEAA